MTSIMAPQTVPDITNMRSNATQRNRPQQRRKQGRRDPKQIPPQNQTPSSFNKNDIVIPPRQVQVDFNHGNQGQGQGQGQQNQNQQTKTKRKSNKNKHHNSNSLPAPSLPNGQPINFGNNGIVKAAAEAMLHSNSSMMDKYAGSSFQNEPKAVTLPKPSFLRR